MALIKTAAEILHEVNAARLAPTSPSCGTRYGYRQHRRAGQPACGPCLDIENERNTLRYRRRSSTWPIREWCWSVGLPVAATGLVANRYLDAYHAAHPGSRP